MESDNRSPAIGDLLPHIRIAPGQHVKNRLIQLIDAKSLRQLISEENEAHGQSLDFTVSKSGPPSNENTSQGTVKVCVKGFGVCEEFDVQVLDYGKLEDGVMLEIRGDGHISGVVPS